MDWEGLRTAYLDRERARLGLPTREQERMKREAEARAAAESASQLETAGVAREHTRAVTADMPGQNDLRRRLVEAQIANYNEPNRVPSTPAPHYTEDAAGNVTAIRANPDGTFTTVRLGPIGSPQRPGSGGQVRLVNTVDAQGNPVQKAVRLVEGQEFKPGMTAEQRNVEYQAGAVEPAFTLVKQSLQNFADSSAGGLPGAPSAMIPGTDAYYAKSRFVDQAKALLGAIVARQAGEGSRLSDEDRVAYSQAAALVNSALLLPGGIEEAAKRIDQAERLIGDVTVRRRAVSGGALPMGTTPTAPPSAMPPRPPGVPPEAQWDPVTRRWRL